MPSQPGFPIFPFCLQYVASFLFFKLAFLLLTAMGRYRVCRERPAEVDAYSRRWLTHAVYTETKEGVSMATGRVGLTALGLGLEGWG